MHIALKWHKQGLCKHCTAMTAPLRITQLHLPFWEYSIYSCISDKRHRFLCLCIMSVYFLFIPQPAFTTHSHTKTR